MLHCFYIFIQEEHPVTCVFIFVHRGAFFLFVYILKISPNCRFAMFMTSNISDLRGAYGQRPPWWHTCHLASWRPPVKFVPWDFLRCKVQWLAYRRGGGSLLAGSQDLATSLASAKAAIQAPCRFATFFYHALRKDFSLDFSQPVKSSLPGRKFQNPFEGPRKRTLDARL